MNKSRLNKSKILFSLFIIILLSFFLKTIVHQANGYYQGTEKIVGNITEPADGKKISSNADCPSGCYVHITKTGSKYHSAGCRYLSESDIRICRDDAIKAGYTACKVCGGKCDPMKKLNFISNDSS